jgi:DNA-binding beta-propeller fold protein YncE
MGHADDLKSFLEFALEDYNPYVKVVENMTMNIPTNANRVYVDNPKTSEFNSYLKSYKEKWRLRLDCATKANVDAMTNALLDAIKRFQRRDIDSYFYLSEKEDIEDYVNLYLETFVTQALNYGIPRGVSYSDGFVYQANIANNNRVKKYNTDLSLIWQIDTVGAGDGQIKDPKEACAYGGEVYVSDTGNNRVQVLSATDGSYVRKWGSNGSNDGQFHQMGGLHVYDDEVFTIEIGNDRVQVFALDGTFKRKWGSSGTGDGQFSSADKIHVYNDEVYVTDYTQNRVQVFALDGTYKRQWTTGSYPEGILGLNGEIYICEFNANIISVYDVNGVKQRELPHKSFSLSTDGTYLYIGDTVAPTYIEKWTIFERMKHFESANGNIGKVKGLKYVALDNDSDFRVFITADAAPNCFVLNSDQSYKSMNTMALVDGETDLYYTSLNILKDEIILISNYPMGDDIVISNPHTLPYYPYQFPTGLVNIKLMPQNIGDGNFHNRYHRLFELELEWWS